MNDALETRLAEALEARASLKRVDAASREHRRAQVHAAVDDGVVSLDIDGDDPAWQPDVTDRRRRPVVVVLAAAAAALALVLAGVGLAHRTSRDVPPASGGSEASQRWQGYAFLDHEQSELDLEGVDLLDGDVVSDSVRSLAELGQYRYWAGWDDDGGLHWGVLSPDGTELGSNTAPSTTDPAEVSDGTHAPALYLVPGVEPDTSSLEARGFVSLLPNVLVDADALGTAQELFSRLRAPQTAADAFPEDVEGIGDGRVRPESVRRLAQEGPKVLFVAEALDGDVCLYIVDGDVAGGGCTAPVVVATTGTHVGLGGPEGATTAWLAPDDLDTSGWPALGRRQLTLNLWLEQPAQDSPDPTASTLELADGSTAFVGNAYSGAVPAILVHGRVVLLDGGCLGFEGYEGTDVLVLQHGTTVSADGLGVVTPDGVEVRVGDQVQGGSGGGGVAGTGLQEQWKASSPECFAGRGVAAVDITALG